MTDSKQHYFDWSSSGSMNVERQYLLSKANDDLFEKIVKATTSPSPICMLVGPKHSGKSTLLKKLSAVHDWHFWTEKVSLNLPEWSKKCDLLIVDTNENDFANGHLSEQQCEALFHLLCQRGLDRRLKTIIATRRPATDWKLSLKDLKSRLNAALTIEIPQPDDQLFSNILRQEFKILGFTHEPGLFAYCEKRLEISYESIRKLLAWIDRQAWQSRKGHITKQMLTAFLDEVFDNNDAD